MDDIPDLMVEAASCHPFPEGKFYLVLLFRKWYKVTVEENVVSPVVALFLGKNGALEDWENFYPKDELFQITLPR
ncbi:hypothetical protein FJZ31_06130 [Candidatus Poribacteria bacterium]|nr:hypothetical protein [Candidatus Poribacteria bacterium]